MTYPILIIAALLAILDWFAVATGRRQIEYFAKPAIMLALLAWMWQNNALHGTLIWFAIAIILSLIGDVLLMVPRGPFIGGLAAFLLAHLSYIAGLNPTPPPINLASLILILLLVITGILVYRRLISRLGSRHTRLKTAMLAYSVALGCMLFSALLTLVRTEWPVLPALLVSGGGLLFFFSDTFLAWNRYVSPMRQGRIPSMVTYHLGQMLLVLGACLYYL